MRGHRVSIIAPFLTALLAWSCGGPGSGGAESAGLEGSAFTITVSAEQATADPGAAGTWEIRFAEDGTYTVRGDGEVAAAGRYAVTGDRVTFTDESGPLMCVDDPEATYTFSLSGDEATFTSVDDTCPGRTTVLGAGPLTRQGS
ncbi:MAG: hypothetical protein ACRELC_10340 [Gemmatimonadota bacterium]